MNKDQLKDKIISYLKEVSRTDSLIDAVIYAAIRNNLNFDNLMKLLKDEYNSCPDGLKHCIGEVSTRLILKW